jgi:hypothetical protein
MSTKSQAEVELAGLAQPVAVLAEQAMHGVAGVGAEQRLARAERTVGVERQRPGDGAADDAAEFLEQRVGIGVAERRAQGLARQ